MMKRQLINETGRDMLQWLVMTTSRETISDVRDQANALRMWRTPEEELFGHEFERPVKASNSRDSV